MKALRIVRFALHFDLVPVAILIVGLLVGMLIRLFS